MKNKTLRPVALCAVLLALVAPLAFAQNVQIGGTSLQLGASRADTLAVANAQFQLLPTNVQGQYNIYPKSPTGTTSNRLPPALGTITIANGQLVRVTRNLGAFRSAGGQVAIQNMIAAFSQAPNAGRTPTVHTDSQLAGNASISRVYFSYPDRAIQVVVFQPADATEQATVDITEQYALPDAGAPVPMMPSPAQ